jgi:hypothetical protein
MVQIRDQFFLYMDQGHEGNTEQENGGYIVFTESTNQLGNRVALLHLPVHPSLPAGFLADIQRRRERFFLHLIPRRSRNIMYIVHQSYRTKLKAIVTIFIKDLITKYV